jgi:HAD superfamily hydrolase (TIGR01484 family)
VRYHVLACDYDGTLASDGRVDPATLAALERLKGTGRRLLLVTGRVLEDLLDVFPQAPALFDRLVVENGAVVYNPATREQVLLGERPPEEFLRALRARGVSPLEAGRVIAATWEPHQNAVMDVIKEAGLELQVVFNKGAVMILPSGVNKATGLGRALRELELSAHNTVGVGDAENDHAFLRVCECAVAVANALPMLKERADWVTRGARGDGVQELVERLMAEDLAGLAPLSRHRVLLGERDDGVEVRIPPYGSNLLVAGASGSGKSTFAKGFLERLAERRYQYCIIDPEGDYEKQEGAVVLGDKNRVPGIEEVLELLQRADQNAVVNLLGIPLENRPRYFENLLPRLQSFRARKGRPHWIVLDETHHLLPASRDLAALTLPKEFREVLMITVHPDRVSRAVLSAVDIFVAVGGDPGEAFRSFAEALKREPPPLSSAALEPGEAVGWRPDSAEPPFRFRAAPPRREHRRHQRKYAVGELGPDLSFYFRGPRGKLNLRAQNMTIFVQLMDGIDDDTWLFHLRRGDYSNWFRRVIKDEDLAEETAAVEKRARAGARETRALIRAAVERRYTAPA